MLPPSRSPFFHASALFLSLLLSLLCVVMVIKAKGGGRGGGLDAVVGLVVSWELGMVKWSDSCTHKQCVRWSRRVVGGRGWERVQGEKRGALGVSRERSQFHVFWLCFLIACFRPLRHGIPAVRGILLWNSIPRGRWESGPLVDATCCWRGFFGHLWACIAFWMVCVIDHSWGWQSK